MGIGPATALPKALARAGLKYDQLDLVEINEAFAAQVLACGKRMIDDGHGWDLEKTNVNGGAIALGHPVGCSGARIVTTLLHEMKRRNSRYGAATLCVGGGQGGAIVVERCPLDIVDRSTQRISCSAVGTDLGGSMYIFKAGGRRRRHDGGRDRAGHQLQRPARGVEGCRSRHARQGHGRPSARSTRAGWTRAR